MTSELTNATYDPIGDTRAVTLARVRTTAVFAVTLIVVLTLAAVVWLQVAARFEAERVRTEGETVRNAMAGMLSMGLPLQDFIGFQAISGRILRANPATRAVIVRDRTGRVVLSRPEAAPGLIDQPALLFPPSVMPDARIVDVSGTFSRLALPVFNRFGPAGSLELVFERPQITELTRNAAIAGIAAMLMLATGLIVYVLGIANPEFFQSRRELVGTYAIVSTLGIILAVSALVGLTAEKAQETAGSYTHSLGTRLGEAIELGVSPDDLSGLDEVVQEYRDSNTIIGYVALLEGNRVATGTGIDAVGTHWEQPVGYFDAAYEIRPRRLYSPQYRVLVGIRWQTALSTLAGVLLVPAGIMMIVLMLGTIAITRICLQNRT